MAKALKKVPVWEYFTEVSPGKAQCNICDKIISMGASTSTSKNTTNMWSQSSGSQPGEKGITAAWRSPNGGGNSKTGWELQNRAWLSPIDRQAHDTHAQFFLPINFSANSAPQLIQKILLVVSITVLI